MKETTDKPKLKTETKNISHKFTLEERDQLGLDLAQSFAKLRGIDAEFDQVKSSFKARITEMEARIDRLSTDRTNGFVMRDTPCFVAYNTKQKEKYYFLDEESAVSVQRLCNVGGTKGCPPSECVLTEKMTANDFQQELIEAESKIAVRN